MTATAPPAAARAKRALVFVVLIGVVSLFADMTYEGSRSVWGPFLGTLGVALGIGFGLSAGVAYLLSKAWGLINGGGTSSRLPESS